MQKAWGEGSVRASVVLSPPSSSRDASVTVSLFLSSPPPCATCSDGGLGAGLTSQCCRTHQGHLSSTNVKRVFSVAAGEADLDSSFRLASRGCRRASPLCASLMRPREGRWQSPGSRECTTSWEQIPTQPLCRCVASGRHPVSLCSVSSLYSRGKLGLSDSHRGG